MNGSMHTSSSDPVTQRDLAVTATGDGLDGDYVQKLWRLPLSGPYFPGQMWRLLSSEIPGGRRERWQAAASGTAGYGGGRSRKGHREFKMPPCVFVCGYAAACGEIRGVR